MKPFLFSVQYTDNIKTFTVSHKKGIVFAASYSDAAAQIENDYSNILDLYIYAIEPKTITLTEDAYNQILNNE